MPSKPRLSMEKKHWWMTSRKVADRYVRDARALIATQSPADVSTALSLLDAALAASPRHEPALELKARSLLFLRRFRDVADMLQDYIPSFSASSDDDDDNSTGTSLSSDAGGGPSSQQLSRERVKLLRSDSDVSDNGDGPSLRCFFVADLKRKVLAGLGRSGGDKEEGQWRHIVLGQACSHLGMMEDSLVLLQTGRRLATAALRRESFDRHHDGFSDFPTTATETTNPPLTELDSATHLLNHIKLLLRRRSAAVASLDAGLPSDSIRHFSKILDSRRGALPHAFAASCLIGRAAANRAAGRLADAIADCNRALALDPSSIPALRARAEVLESVRCLPDCLRDLDHLKLLYDAVLRDRKLPGPRWRPHPPDVRYRDVPQRLRELTAKVQELRQRVGKEQACNGAVDYYALIGVRRGCSRSELERAHLLLVLKHRPEKAAGFVDRVEFAGEHRDIDTVRDQARMSALILNRLLQKGYSNIMAAIVEEEAAEKQKAAARYAGEGNEKAATAAVAAAAAVFQGVFCRDMAVVGGLLSQVGFGGQGIPVKYEGVSC